MPYSMYKSGGKYCVRNKDTGESKGCSATKKMAAAHMRALYAAEGGAEMGKKELDEFVVKAIDEYNSENPDDTIDKDYMAVEYVPYDVTTFEALADYRAAQEQASEIHEVTQDFVTLASNILTGTPMEDRASALKALADEYGSRINDLPEVDLEEKAVTKAEGDCGHPSSHYLVVEDSSKPTTWHLRVKNCQGNYDRGLAGAAWAALHKGYRGNKYGGPSSSSALSKLKGIYKSQGWDLPSENKELEEDEQSGLFERIVDAIKSIFPTSKPSDEDQEQMMIWKEANGDYRWVARYSNNFRDRSNPPEIISEKSHKRFVDLVEKGLAPMPELWLWHTPDLCIGKADWVGYDDSGFALAAGSIRKEFSDVAEWLMTRKDVLLSHGMPKRTVARDPNEPSVIVEHETKEISILPDFAAANLITGFFVFKEDEMAITPDKRAALEKWGLKKEYIDLIEAANVRAAEKAQEAGLDSKEVADATTEPVAETSTEATATTTEAPVTEVKEPEYPTREEVAEAITTVVMPLINDHNTQLADLSAKIEALTKALADQTSTFEEQVKKAIADTPPASISSILMARAVGNRDAEVKKKETFSAPKETPAPDKPGATGIPFIDTMIGRS